VRKLTQRWLNQSHTYLVIIANLFMRKLTHNNLIINVGHMTRSSCSQNMIIIMLNLFIMIQYHNKNYHRRWSDDKITVT
jgi:hypothetical protein